MFLILGMTYSSISPVLNPFGAKSIEKCYVRDVFQDFFQMGIGKCGADAVFGRIKFLQRNEKTSHHVYIS